MDIATGTSIVDQSTALIQVMGQLKLQAAQMALSHDEAMAGLGQQAAATAAQLQASLAGIQERAQEAQNQYDIDLKNYGLGVAQFNYQQRQGKLQGDLAIVAEGANQVRQRTETAMANYSQRQGVVQDKLQIMDMLTKRSGPSNYVQYNSLLNELAPPNGQTTTIDPFQMLNGLYQPISDKLPDWAAKVSPTSAGLNQPMAAQGASPGGATAGMTYSGAGAGAGSGGVGAVGATPGAGGSSLTSDATSFLHNMLQPQAPPAYSASDPATSGVPIGAVTNLVRGDKAYVTTGGAGPSLRSDYDPSLQVFDANGVPITGGSIAPGTKLQLQRMAKGGIATPPPAGGPDHQIGPVVVGDSPSGAPTGNEEMATVKTNDPNAQLQVQPANPAGMEAQAMNGDPAQQAQAALSAAQQALAALGDAVAKMGGSAAPGGPTGGPDLMQAGGGPPMKPPGMATGGTMMSAPTDARPMPSPRPKAGYRPVPKGSKAPKQPPSTSGSAPTGAKPLPKPSRPAQPYGGLRRMATGGVQEVNDYGNDNGTQAIDTVGTEQPAVTQPGAVAGTSAQRYPGGPAPMTFADTQARRQGMMERGIGPRGFGAMPAGAGAPGAPAAGGDIPVDTVTHGPLINGQSGGMARPHPFLSYLANLGIQPGQGNWRASLQDWLRTLGIPHMAAGGTMGTEQPGTQPWDVYNGGNTNPTFDVTRYTPEQLGQLPFIQKLFGNAPSVQFQGFGGTLSNPAIGINNAPSMLNLQKYNSLLPSEQDMAESLYTQGLGMDMRDIMTRSARAQGFGGLGRGAAAYG